MGATTGRELRSWAGELLDVWGIWVSRVSIVIPCFDDGAFLPEAYASALGDSYRDVEVILVDDGSTDPLTLRVLIDLERSGARIVRQPHGGVSAARNAGIEVATGEYILPLDADDRLGETFVDHAASLLSARPDIAIVGGDTELFGDANDRWDFVVPHPVDWLLKNPLPATAMFRRRLWEEVGGYTVGVPWGEDWLLWVKMLGAGAEVAAIPEIALYYRRRPGQVTSLLPRTAEVATRALVLTAGLEIARRYPEEFGTRLAPRLALLHLLRARYARVERLRGRVARLSRWLRLRR